MSLTFSPTTKHTVAVIATVEEWSSMKSLLQESSGDKHHQVTFSSLVSHQVCDLMVHGHSISLHYADLKQDMSDEDITNAIEGCFKSCTGGIGTFLLLIQGGHYTKRERRMVEILQAHFGPEALNYLVILSLEDGKVVDTLDDSLLDLINICNGRYCRMTSTCAGEKMKVLLEVIDHMLAENCVSGFTEAMLVEAWNRSSEVLAMKILRRKVQEAEEKEQTFKQLVQEHEQRRAREIQEFKAKHAEEREKEATEEEQHETKRESLEEAVKSHMATMQLQMSPTNDEETKAMSVILLGLSGSGKTSALNLILERASNQYSVNESSHESPRSTLACERKEVSAAGKRLILVDTPELWDEDGAENLELVKDCLALSLPGPHVFLLVLQVGRFTQGESDMLGQLQKIFGREFAEHTIVLFVGLDGHQHRPQRINDYVTGAHPSLQDLLQKCGSRYFELNIAKPQNALIYSQVKDLLSGMNKLVASFGGRSCSVRRFSKQELQDRKKVIQGRREGVLEVNCLLGES
ncbi:GTPase IMAP family member 8-like [Echeneis naucrates]|uniref:GTPase IMAP family member 8-like n=1 Tax=Echeneis naucrates TaxID=173247 RepID=A0A665VB91_ECHNA|nr:GTPase IMAP family member 8-like [Echeneis naucrates]